MQYNIDCSSTTGPLRPFWASTGFTPATLLLTRDMRQQITYCGSIPRGGLRYARVHYLLELVGAAFAGADAAQYDWTRLDAALDLLIENGLVPIFELMGNPDGQFNNFNDPLQLRRWRSLVRDLALHYQDRYSEAEVERWYFEAWNEPDGGFGWAHQWPQDEQSFCNYYDACVEGLKAANPRLTIGGPGTCQTLSSLFRAFLAHCDDGKNYFNGESGVRLDFISIHEKGVKPHKEDLTPRTADLLVREARIVEYIRTHHPRFAATPFMNNECDPQVGWKDYHTWHARPYYAAWACRSVGEHLEHLVNSWGVDYAILGNDHGFIGEWGHRTLLARFGKADWIEDGQGGHVGKRGWAQADFSTPAFAMIKKPIFNAMTLLSLLGDEQLAWDASGAPDQPAEDAGLNLLATRASDDSLAILVYNTRDKINTSGSQFVRLRLKNIPFQSGVLAHYRIDEVHGDPYTLWEAAGAPDLPNSNLLAAMRENQELALFEEPAQTSFPGGCLDLRFDLPLHSVSLVLLLANPAVPPARVTGLRFEAFEGLNGNPEHLLRWDPLPARTICTYEVQRADTPEGEFRRINPSDLLCSAWMSTAGPGAYKVAARDFWGRLGGESEVISIE